MNVRDFFEHYGIDGLQVSPDGDIREREISRVDVHFGKDSDDAGKGYVVTFKLLEGASDAHRFLKGIGRRPDCVPEWTVEGSQLGNAVQEQCLADLIAAITGRVDKVHTEQSILNIQPLGKSFLLMGQTRFDVLSDDGEGQLLIRLHRDEGPSEAGLTANDLLDGLYTGLITRA